MISHRAIAEVPADVRVGDADTLVTRLAREGLTEPGAIVRLRRALHGRPEIAFEESGTARLVAELLRGWGYDVMAGIGGTGLVASLRRGSGGRTVAVRAEMDALPIAEATGLPYRSQVPDRMHACGHDGHMSMALAAAATLATEGGFDGTVRFVFQPAEEPGRGAQAMLDDGLLERFPFDAIYGLHNLPGLPAGVLATREGGLMASEDDFEIVVTGRGGHAARPEAVVDPLVVAAEIITALQSIVARNVAPSRPAVVSCTEIHGNGARNAIPGVVTITGDTRSFDAQTQALLEERMRTLCAGIAQAHGAQCAVTYTHEFAPTRNDARCTEVAVAAARRVLGADRVDADCEPVMLSEDFGVFGRHVPASFALLGNGTDDRCGTPLHSPFYDFNDEILDSGARYFVEVVRAELAPGSRAAAD